MKAHRYTLTRKADLTKRTINRRDAMKMMAASTGIYLTSKTGSRAVDSPNEKLNVALIGIGGQGGSNLRGVSSQNIVALCDVDEKRGAKSFGQFPKAAKFSDYRVMFDKMEKDIDAVVVSTPDHTHFNPSMIAMSLGKHLYCEKPMAHNVWQVRKMTELAAKNNLATQLGVQRHTIGNVHRVVELIRAGVIGNVTEVHSWVGGNRGMPSIPKDKQKVPAHLNWDVWLGPAPKRDYNKAYCPYNWRFWWDFGTGETGNWGCHTLDIPFWSLKLDYPTRVEGSGPEVHPQTTPKSMITSFQYPAKGDRGGVTLHWYHTRGGPKILKDRNLSLKGANNVFVGTEGILVCGFGTHKLYPEEKFSNLSAPEQSIPDSPGFHKEWIAACKGGKTATCNFDYSGPLTETVLLGNVAYQAGGGFRWDSKNLKAIGNDTAQRYIREAVRKGWEIS